MLHLVRSVKIRKQMHANKSTADKVKENVGSDACSCSAGSGRLIGFELALQFHLRHTLLVLFELGAQQSQFW